MVTVLAGMSAAILAFAPITNPAGSLAAFAGFIAGNVPAAVRSQAWKTGIYVFAILTVSVASGSLIMYFPGFNLPSLQTAGGLAVAHPGLSMLGNKRHATYEETQHATSRPDVSFSPMALPLVAGPGPIGVIITLVARDTIIGFHVDTILGIAVTAVVIALLLRYGTSQIDKLGATDVDATVHIMDFLIPIIGVELIIHGMHALQFF